MELTKAGLAKRGIIIAAVLVGIILLLLLLTREKPEETETEGYVTTETDIRQGVAYLQGLEQGDVTEIENTLKEYRRQQMQAERQERLEQLVNGEVDVWTLFEDCVIMGDSRGVGFSLYGFMPENRVFANSGAHVTDVVSHLEELKQLNPATIFLAFGVNDIPSGVWSTPEEYAAAYVDTCRTLMDEIPGVMVFANSVLDVKEFAYGNMPQLGELASYNAALQTACLENGVGFVDNDNLFQNYSDLWEVDGIHLTATLYPYWASNMIMALYDAQEGITSEDTE